MKLDYLKGTTYQIKQEAEMYHMNSDSELLGQFMEIHPSDRVLDVGCNQGVLMLYASLGKPKELVGIDLFEEVIALADENLKMNKVNAKTYVSSIQEFQDETFDCIICNPPYFHGTWQKKENEYLKAARHQEYLPLKELFEHTSRLLKEDGRFYMVYRPQYLNEVLQNAYQYQFGLKQIQFIYDKNTKEARTVLLEFVKSLTVEVQVKESYY